MNRNNLHNTLTEEQKVFIAETFKMMSDEHPTFNHTTKLLLVTLKYLDKFGKTTSEGTVNKYKFYKQNPKPCLPRYDFNSTEHLGENNDTAYLEHIKKDFILYDGTFATVSCIYDLGASIQKLVNIVKKQHNDIVDLRAEIKNLSKTNNDKA